MAELKKLDLNQSKVVAPVVAQANKVVTPVVVQANKVVQSLPTSTSTMSKKTLYGISALILILGIASGYGLNLFSRSQIKNTQGGGVEVSSNLKVGYTVGSDDERAFKDSAEGVIEKGGLDGEGSHKLLRPGGPSQTVYLTSSVIDLDEFEGHKVKVWGETFAAQKAGWLMDVGRVEVKELNASVE